MPDDVAKMVGLDVSETSGVDMPAHLTPGWVVVKAAAAPKSPETEENTVPDAPAEDVAKAAFQCPKCKTEMVKKAAELDEAETVAKAMEAMPEPVRKAYEAVTASLQAAEAREAEAVAKAQKVADEAADAEAVTKAAPFKGLGLEPETFGPIMRVFKGVSAEGAEAVEKALTAALAVSAEGEKALFTEVGKAAPHVEGQTADEQMTALAKAAVADGHADNVTKAIGMVALSNPALYAAYVAEQKG